MTVTEMKNKIAHIYGLENYVTIMFYGFCEDHSYEEICKYYTACLAIPVYDED